MTGYFTNTLDFGIGALSDVGTNTGFIVKFDPTGAPLWNHAIGVADPLDVAVDSMDYIVVTGSVDGTFSIAGGPSLASSGRDIFVARLNPSGTHVWSSLFGDGATQSAFTVATGPSDTITIGGFAEGTIDFGGGALTALGKRDGVVVRLGSSGQHLWSQRFGGQDSVFDRLVVRQLAVNAQGEVALTGEFSGTISFGGTPHVANGTSDDIVVAKLANATGEHLWSKSAGAADQGDRGWGIAFDSTGAVVVSGDYRAPIDFGGGLLPTPGGNNGAFLVKYDGSGQHLWSHGFVSPSDITAALGIAVNATDDVLLTGGFQTTIDLGAGLYTAAPTVTVDSYLAGYDATGNHLASNHFGTSGTTQTYEVVTVGSGAIVIGELSGSADFGTGELVSAGNADIFIAEFPP